MHLVLAAACPLRIGAVAAVRLTAAGPRSGLLARVGHLGLLSGVVLMEAGLVAPPAAACAEADERLAGEAVFWVRAAGHAAEPAGCQAVGTGCQHGVVRFAINIPNFGDFADPRAVADLAKRAEAAGWDGLFIWDHVTHEKRLLRAIGDPWVLLTAAALATRRIRLGTMITPIARRRVAKLAREVTTLDRLSEGRMVLGAGLGAPIGDEFGSFGEPTDPRLLAARLDEGLAALNLLWSGEPVNFRGAHVRIDDVAFRPVPVQRPRVPVWVGGNWPNKAPMRRAARWDGAVPNLDPSAVPDARPPDPATVRALHAFLRRCRDEAGNGHKPFDLVVGGTSPAGTGATQDVFGSLGQAGATWWQECMPWDERLDRAGPMLRRAEQGPAQDI